MAAEASGGLLALLDRAPLDRRYWTIFALLAAVYIFDFFDLSLIAFILAAIGRRWHLTYGQSALILYGSGLGAILGALLWGGLADRFGRRAQTVTGTLICAISAGSIGFLPTGAYLWLAVLRIGVGFGLAAAITPALTLIVELTPTRRRTIITSFFVQFATVGGLLSSAGAATLMGWLGWRGVAMLGILPLAVGLLVWRFVPESVRWLAAKGRVEAARAEAAHYLRLPLDRVPPPAALPATQPRAALRELYAHRRLFWQTLLTWGASTTAIFGYALWGPTIVALTLHTSVAQAARYFVYVAVSAIVGRIVVALVAPLTGRRRIGVMLSLPAGVCLALAGYYSQVVIGGFPLLIVLLAATAFFIEGGMSNIAPYTIEQYGVRLGGRSSGLAHAAAGFGKIAGPLVLALIAGTGNLVRPQATEAAVFPAFLLLAFCMLLVTFAFLFLSVEMHGREIGFEPEGAPARQPDMALRPAGTAD